jgi:hypothetical protein
MKVGKLFLYNGQAIRIGPKDATFGGHSRMGFQVILPFIHTRMAGLLTSGGSGGSVIYEVVRIQIE